MSENKIHLIDADEPFSRTVPQMKNTVGIRVKLNAAGKREWIAHVKQRRGHKRTSLVVWSLLTGMLSTHDVREHF